jgi:hypothetical protein
MKEDLEDRITKAGREKVFACARSRGWRSGDPVPEFVWWDIIREIEAENS